MIDEYRPNGLAVAEAIASPYHPGAEPGSAGTSGSSDREGAASRGD
jgi:hypothetical protein